MHRARRRLEIDAEGRGDGGYCFSRKVCVQQLRHRGDHPVHPGLPVHASLGERLPQRRQTRLDDVRHRLGQEVAGDDGHLRYVARGEDSFQFHEPARQTGKIAAQRRDRRRAHLADRAPASHRREDRAQLRERVLRLRLRHSQRLGEERYDESLILHERDVVPVALHPDERSPETSRVVPRGRHLGGHVPQVVPGDVRPGAAQLPAPVPRRRAVRILLRRGRATARALGAANARGGTRRTTSSRGRRARWGREHRRDASDAPHRSRRVPPTPSASGAPFRPSRGRGARKNDDLSQSMTAEHAFADLLLRFFVDCLSVTDCVRRSTKANLPADFRNGCGKTTRAHAAVANHHFTLRTAA